MKQRLLLCAVFAAMPLTTVKAATLSDVFTSFYVLGDSNSDWGNFGEAGPPPPYFNSQFSNGPVWADILDDQFETGDPDDIRTWNYAFGGARVTEDSDAPDLPTQLNVFGADLDPTIPDPLPGTPTLGDRPLVSIWFGANDIRSIYQDYLAAAEFAGTLDPADQSLALEEAERIARLAASGVGATYGATLEAVAQVPGFNDLLTFTTADAGVTPEYDDPVGASLLTELSVLFNEQLTRSLESIEAGGANVYSVDIFGLQGQVRADPGAFGFSNVEDACLTLSSGIPSLCDDPDSYLYWDEIGHLSAAGHRALAGIVEETILSAQPHLTPIPLPASLPALGAGLLLLGLLGRRKS